MFMLIVLCQVSFVLVSDLIAFVVTGKDDVPLVNGTLSSFMFQNASVLEKSKHS